MKTEQQLNELASNTFKKKNPDIVPEYSEEYTFYIPAFIDGYRKCEEEEKVWREWLSKEGSVFMEIGGEWFYNTGWTTQQTTYEEVYSEFLKWYNGKRT
jgi:hypothetical protein